MFALDTNTLIYFFKGLGHVGSRLLAVSPQEVAIPAVALYEIEYGIARSPESQKRRRALDALLSVVQILPFDRSCAQAAADARAHLEEHGMTIGPMDLLIAGTALAHAAILVTHNTREFARVPHLRHEDWY